MIRSPIAVNRREERREPERCTRARARAQGTVIGFRNRAAPPFDVRREPSTREGRRPKGGEHPGGAAAQSRGGEQRREERGGEGGEEKGEAGTRHRERKEEEGEE